MGSTFNHALLLVCLFAATLCRPGQARGDAHVLTALEARGGIGLALGGGQGNATLRRSPMHIGMLIERAISEHPWTAMTIGGYIEGGDRMAVAGQLGLRVKAANAFRLSGQLSAVLSPYSLIGAGAGIGRCTNASATTSICLDLDLSVFFAGSDLPDDRVAGQLQLLLGARFDVL